MTQREEFEAWADSYGLCCEPLTRESVEYDCFEAYKAGQAAQPVQPSPAQQVCLEAYQVVGSLLSDLNQFDTDGAVKILDNLSQCRIVHSDVLPWPSFAQPVQPSQAREEPKCSTHPDAPHGFDRNASHTNDRYTCDCEGWHPELSADKLERYLAANYPDAKGNDLTEAVIDALETMDIALGMKEVAQPVQPIPAREVEPIGYVVEHNVPPQSSGKWSFHPLSQGLSFYKDTALVITPVYAIQPDTEAKDAALRAALWDAKRYRYLRDNCVIQNRASTDGPAYKELRFHGKIYPDWRFAIDHLGLDAAVDAAIAQIEALDIAAINAKETK